MATDPLLGLREARSTHTRIRPQAMTLMQPHSGKGRTSNCTRSNRDAKGQPSAPPRQSHQHAPQTPTPSTQQPHELPALRASQVSGLPGPRRLRRAGAPNSRTQPESLDTQCHPHSVQPTPGTYPHLGGSAGRAADRPMSGGRKTGSGAGSGWGASAAPAPRWERASVGPSVPPHRGCGGRGLRLLICPRPRGEVAPANQERHRADGQLEARPPVLQLCFPFPPSPLQPCFCKVAVPPRS